MDELDDIQVGDAVEWNGRVGLGPAIYGRVDKIAHHDNDSLRVQWWVWKDGPDKMPIVAGYTWERRKNLAYSIPLAAV